MILHACVPPIIVGCLARQASTIDGMLHDAVLQPQIVSIVFAVQPISRWLTRLRETLIVCCRFVPASLSIIDRACRCNVFLCVGFRLSIVECKHDLKHRSMRSLTIVVDRSVLALFPDLEDRASRAFEDACQEAWSRKEHACHLRHLCHLGHLSPRWLAGG